MAVLRLRVDRVRLGGYTEEMGNFNFMSMPETGQKVFLRPRGFGGVGEMYEVKQIVHTPSNEDEEAELGSVQVLVEWTG